LGGGAVTTTSTGDDDGSSVVVLLLLLLLLSCVSFEVDDGTVSDCFSSDGGSDEGSLGLATGRGGGGRGPLLEEAGVELEVELEEEVDESD